MSDAATAGGDGRAGRRGRWGIGARIAVIAALQTAVLLALVGMRQYTLTTGTHVILATAPVDPRSLFQGDYIDLAYEIGRLDLPPGVRPQPGGRIWAVLAPPDGAASAAPWQVRRVSAVRPDDLGPGEVAIRGTVNWLIDDCGSPPATGDRGPDAPSCVEAFVTYGIETFFVPEGEGRPLETAGTRITVEAAVDRFGTPAIAALRLDGRPIHVEGLF